MCFKDEIENSIYQLKMKIQFSFIPHVSNNLYDFLIRWNKLIWRMLVTSFGCFDSHYMNKKYNGSQWEEKLFGCQHS